MTDLRYMKPSHRDCLIALSREWTPAYRTGFHSSTLDALVRRGLAEARYRSAPMGGRRGGWCYRLTTTGQQTLEG